MNQHIEKKVVRALHLLSVFTTCRPTRVFATDAKVAIETLGFEHGLGRIVHYVENDVARGLVAPWKKVFECISRRAAVESYEWGHAHAYDSQELAEVVFGTFI